MPEEKRDGGSSGRERALSYMFSVCHANSVLYYLLSAFYLLHDAHQLPRVLGHFVREGADAVGHVQDGCTDLIRFRLKNSVLERKSNMTASLQMKTSNMKRLL